MYKAEFKECKSIRGRFQQNFVYGERQDCQHWGDTYNNCQKWEWLGNEAAAIEVIRSEMVRRDERLKAHLANDTWTRRDKPPDNFSGPLPDWMQQRNKGSYLEIKAKELKEREEEEKLRWKESKENNEMFSSSKSSCSIM